MVLNLYDEDGNLVLIDLSNKIGSGGQGNVYRIDDSTCFKYYVCKKMKNGDELLKIIRTMNLDNFYKIRFCVYDDCGNLAGYMMDYIDGDRDLNILDKDVHYTIDNFISLYEAAIRLSEENIMMVDFNADNVILCSDKIMAVDVDIYIFGKSIDDDVIFEKNTGYVYKLFRELYKRALVMYYMEDVSSVDKKIIDDLFLSKREPNLVCKKLVKYRKPIDYIYDMRNR